MSRLLEAMETIAGAPVEAPGLADAVALSAEKLFYFDGLQFGIYETSQLVLLKRIQHGLQLPPLRTSAGIEQDDMAGWSLRHRAPHVYSLNSPGDQDRPERPSLAGQTMLDRGEILMIPIHGSAHPLGLLALERGGPERFTDSDIDVAARMAGFLAPVMSRLRSHAEVEARATQMGVLTEISQRLISLQPLEDRFQHVAPVICQAFDFAEVRLYECQQESVVLRAVSPNARLEAQELGLGEGLAGLAALERKTFEQRELDHGEDEGDPDTPILVGNSLAVPMMVEDRILGVLLLTHLDGRPFAPAQVTFAELVASLLAIATLEARNFAQQQEYTWINTVLLEVAQHAAQPGDPETALRAVLQLTTLLAGAPWAALLLPDEASGLLRLGPASGLNRPAFEQLGRLRLEPSDFGLAPPYPDTETATEIELPTSVQQTVSETDAVIFALSDGQRLVGVLMVGGPSKGPSRRSLLTGIAHQISLRIENARLIEEAAAQRSLERELATARSIQESFLPEDLPGGSGWDVGAIWVAARQVGGDFYDFIPLPDGPQGPRWGVAIADVADKGVPAALFMALCRTLLRSIASTYLEPGAALTRLNQLIFAETRPDLFVSLFYAVWEPQSGRVTYANGGHNPPLLRDAKHQVVSIRSHNMLLGVDANAEYQTHEMQLPTGGMLLLYTDGVTEAFDPGGSQYGPGNLERLLQGAPENLERAGVDRHGRECGGRVLVRSGAVR